MFGKHHKKSIVTFLVLSLLILTVTVGGTVAYLKKRSDSATNTFNPITVDSTALYNEGTISVQNSGDVTAFLRATVLVNWVAVDSEGNATGVYHGTPPTESLDYAIVFDNTGKWQRGTDGFWYYHDAVAAGAATAPLVMAFARIATPPEGYRLSVEVISSGLQSTPEKATEEAWGVTVSGDTMTPN